MLSLMMLSGCTSNDAATNASATPEAMSSPTSSSVQPVTLQPIEVFNETLTFTSTLGGSAGSGNFVVPTGYGNVTVTLIAFANCPGYVRAAFVGITVAADEQNLAVPIDSALDGAPVEDANGYVPYACAAIDYVQGRGRAIEAVVQWGVQPGTGSIAAQGEFTGNVLVIVIASP